MPLVVGPPPPRLVGASPAIEALRGAIEHAAQSTAKVLITGESGAGKEIVAASIHAASGRRHAAFVTLNCAGVPDALLESELFGHERGSFTDAYRDKPGLLELAHGGTVLLDEIGEMSPRLQAVLLRFLESGEIQRVGSRAAGVRLDVRVIAATHVPLADRVAAKAFRQDLFYRLNVVHLDVPPVRERREDIPLLLRHFLDMHAARHGSPAIPEPSPEVLARLAGYDWPGNVREIKNVAERLVVMARSGVIAVGDLPAEIVQATDTPARAPEPHARAVAERLFHRMVTGGESFWETVWAPFMAHDLTRQDVRLIVSMGLQKTRYRYRLLAPAFNVDPADYKRFLGVLRQFDCYLPLEGFRSAPLRLGEGRRESDRRKIVG
jgi:DNA-binding NtrC family response regulator